MGRDLNVCWSASACHSALTPLHSNTQHTTLQSNSEHSRHWFFRGDIVLDGERMPYNLFDIVRAPLDVSLRG